MLDPPYGTSYDDPSLTQRARWATPGALLRFAAMRLVSGKVREPGKTNPSY
jgi:hypothetical protein